jgi:Phosphotransferase enzyme family
MADEQRVLESAIDGFFLRSGLTLEDQRDCYNLIRQLYPDRSISPASCQGYCSMTVFMGEDTVIQFRPYTYRLNLLVSEAARAVYNDFAPETKYITTLPRSGLLVYCMGRIAGVSFNDFRASRTLASKVLNLERLCKDFASFVSRAWQKRDNKQMPLGQIGKSILSRLETLSTNLPLRFQPRAKHILRNLHHIEALPWVLTHGDIVASNIMVDASTGNLTGFVDWAEAECLPFGICFYGLEEILGEMTPTEFHYNRDATELRQIFWTEMSNNIPELRQDTVLEAVKLSRDLGVLLWHGIAFDDGAIDRVVQEGRDIDEIRRLDAFLDLHEYSGLDRTSKM